jgi:phosphatidylserine/phosphatidylglycerophosphate/cardiolipin synthase-like enzyme
MAVPFSGPAPVGPSSGSVASAGSGIPALDTARPAHGFTVRRVDIGGIKHHHEEIQQEGDLMTSPTTTPTPATTTPFSWDNLGQYKAEGRFLDGYPDDQRTFFSPRDNVHGLLVALLDIAQHSIVVNMFGYDDDELNKIIQGKLANENVYVQMSLDRSQASGVHEKQILASWSNNTFGNSIAIGTSSVHNAISHLKIVIVDGVYTVKGSTNWSLSGEQEQDNELTLSRNAVVAAETRAILDLNHDFMLKQMGGSGLDFKPLMAPTTGSSVPPLPPAPPSATG